MSFGCLRVVVAMVDERILLYYLSRDDVFVVLVVLAILSTIISSSCLVDSVTALCGGYSAR